MKVAIVGSSGGMGSFFARYFLSKGDEVNGSDTRRTKISQPGFKFHRSNRDAVRGCDLTIIATPMGRTLEVAKEVAGSLRRGSVLVEITSVKGETLAKLRSAVGKRARLLSVHPLFGPALEPKSMKIAVICRRGSKKDARLAEELFPEARIIEMTQAQHDRTMAVVLSLTHLLNFVYAKTASKYLAPSEFMRVSTPNSSMQMTVAEAILAQDPGLCYDIQSRNRYSRRVARDAARELKDVMAMLARSDRKAFEAYFAELARAHKTGRRGGQAIREVYSGAEARGGA